VVTPLAGTIETLFAGWELVGLSSALLVAFFHERPAPVKNGLRVWGVYRVSDAALLLASVALHHLTGDGDFSKFLGSELWPEGHTTFTPWPTFVVGFLLLVAAAGKSALVPFSGWLPRAMEGPTPSSAVFYGALSVHLGAFLLLRVSPMFDASLPLALAVIGAGLATAIFATLAEKAQSDIKSALSFAALCQVGIIVTEVGLSSLIMVTAGSLGGQLGGFLAKIGFGLRYVALIHLLGHACLRTLQFVRAPTILLDVRSMENALGGKLSSPTALESAGRAQGFRIWLYRFALERGYLDAMLDRWVVAPFVRLFGWCDAAERRWTDFLARNHSRESDDLEPAAAPFEDLL
jgi:NAD(P)H-quinone oxidoreductase subunit 5